MNRKSAKSLLQIAPKLCVVLKSCRVVLKYSLNNLVHGLTAEGEGGGKLFFSSSVTLKLSSLTALIPPLKSTLLVMKSVLNCN